MANVSRSDFYRILLPGAIAVVLIDIALRVIALTPDPAATPHTISLISRAIGLVEDPFRGVAIAFSVGFALYFIDPGYMTTAYRSGLPSTYVAELSRQKDLPDKYSTSIYFQLLNEHMPDNLRERSLLYGAFFRIGVLAIIMAMLIGVALPTLLLLYSISPQESSPLFRVLDPSGALGAQIAVGMAFITVLAWWWRRATEKRNHRDRDYDDRSKGANKPEWNLLDSHRFVAAAIFAIGGLGWLLAALLPIPASAGRWVVSIASAVSGLAWIGARLAGPLASWFAVVRAGQPYYRSQGSFQAVEQYAIDVAYVATGYLGLALIASELYLVQVLATLSLSITAMALSFVRKHERQQHGIYSNQRSWIASHWNLTEQLIRDQVAVDSDLN